jgi:hypothetical protein
MAFNIKEIVKAWITAANPSPEQVTLAEKRYEICSKCDLFGVRDITKDKYCKSCGCPLNKKIFSNNFDACPHHYWLEIEKEHKSILISNEKKKTNTLI